jgi:hypothetical protein
LKPELKQHENQPNFKVHDLTPNRTGNPLELSSTATKFVDAPSAMRPSPAFDSQNGCIVSARWMQKKKVHRWLGMACARTGTTYIFILRLVVELRLTGCFQKESTIVSTFKFIIR